MGGVLQIEPTDASDQAFDLYEYIPFRLVQTQLRMHHSLKPEDAPEAVAIADLSQTEFRILCLAQAMPVATPSMIADEHGFDRAMVTRMLALLVKKGLVTTRPMPSDQRSKSIHLTPKAKEYLIVTQGIMQSYGELLDGALEDGEKALLFELLEKLVAANRRFDEEKQAG